MDDIEFIAASTLCLVTIYNCMVMLNEENIRRLNPNHPVNQNEPSINTRKQSTIKKEGMRKSNLNNNNLEEIERERRRIASSKILNGKRRRRIEHEDHNLIEKMIKINQSRMKNNIGKIVPKKRRIRRFWTIEAYQRSKNDIENNFQKIMKESAIFRRMSMADFEILLSKLEPLITKQDTNFRICIPPKMRLAITLRFLSTGETQIQLQQLFNISSSAIQRIINEVSKAILRVLEKEIKTPETSEEWLAIEEGYRNNFPHCTGTLVSKKIIIRCSPKPSSTYHQYNNIIFLGVVDSNYNFIYADICKPNKEQPREGGLLKNSTFLQKINTNTINLPAACPFQDGNKNVPYVFVGDGSFGLEPHIMEPFPGYHEPETREEDFNQRLAKTRVGIDNIFGLITSVFGIFDKPVECHIEKASTLVMCCVLLHNFLYKSESSRCLYAPIGAGDYIENGVIVKEGSWRNVQAKNCLRSLKPVAHYPSVNALDVRTEFANYFYNRNKSRIERAV